MKHQCPNCGVDVLQTGFRAMEVTLETWMKVQGEVRVIDTGSHKQLEPAYCAECEAKLPWPAEELKKAA